jgi:hypothetical protein
MSNVPRAVLEAEQLADRLQEELIKAKQQPQSTEAPAPANESAPAEQTPAPTENPAPANGSQDDTSWEHRYKVMQGKYNSEVPRLSAENKELRQRLDALEADLQAAKAQPPAPLVTPEEVDQYGEGLIDVARRIAREELAAKQTEIDTLRDRIEQLTQTTSKTAKSDFLRSLTAIVSDWETLNTDPGFLAWLDGVDDLTGEPRGTLLSRAEKAGDAVRVAKFFTSYQQTQSNRAATTTQALEQQVVPPTNRTPNAPPAKKVWTRGEISQFYQRVKRGEVSEQEQVALEADIHAASVEGRIR